MQSKTIFFGSESFQSYFLVVRQLRLIKHKNKLELPTSFELFTFKQLKDKLHTHHDTCSQNQFPLHTTCKT